MIIRLDRESHIKICKWEGIFINQSQCVKSCPIFHGRVRRHFFLGPKFLFPMNPVLFNPMREGGDQKDFLTFINIQYHALKWDNYRKGGWFLSYFLEKQHQNFHVLVDLILQNTIYQSYTSIKEKSDCSFKNIFYMVHTAGKAISLSSFIYL